MAAFLACQPLCVLSPTFHEAVPVPTCLDEPMRQHVDVKEIVCLAATLDVAAERVEKVAGAEFTEASHARLARLETLCRTLAPQQKPADTLAGMGIFDCYPSLAALMCGHQWGTAAQQPGAAYLDYVSLLNQVVMMGTQLYNDALVPQHHKYAAHQIALLYQSLNMLQGDTKPIRRMVETRFDEIKTVTESSRPTLAPDTSNWLQQVTWVCREEVASCPGYVHKQLAPMMQLLKADPQQPRASGWQPQASEWQPQASGWQPQASEWQPQASGWQPQASGWQPQASGWQPQASGWQPQACGYQ